MSDKYKVAERLWGAKKLAEKYNDAQVDPNTVQVDLAYESEQRYGGCETCGDWSDTRAFVRITARGFGTAPRYDTRAWYEVEISSYDFSIATMLQELLEITEGVDFPMEENPLLKY